MGVNLWAVHSAGIGWPNPRSPEYKKGPGAFAEFWVVDPGEVHAGLIVTVASRYRKVAVLVYPDKHPGVPQKVPDELTSYFRAMAEAKDGLINWLVRLTTG